MKILRVLPLVFLACGAVGLSGCASNPFARRPMPGSDGEVKIESTQPPGEKLPEIVALPPAPTPPPAAAVAPTTAPAASKPGTTMKSAPEGFDDPIPSTKARATKRPTKPVAGHAASPHAKTYTVQRGDTLQKISQKMYGTTKSWQRIFDANKSKLKKPDMVVVGMVLQIP